MLEVLSNAVDVSSMSDVELHESVVDLQAEIERLNAIQSTQLAEWHSRKIWADNGSLSAGHRLARETGLSIKDAKFLVTRARRLSCMPLTLAAFLDGSLCSSRVNLLVRINQPRLSDLFIEHEKMLVGMAKSLSFSDAERALKYWADYADEDGTEDKGRRLTAGRNASIAKTFDGNVDLRAWLDPIGGDVFFNELQRREDELFEADWARAKALYGENVTVECLERSPTQRRCDALVEMAKRSASAGSGAGGGPSSRPLVSVVLGNEGFARVCELADGTIIAPGLVVPLLAEADIERIVFDGSKRVIDVSRKRRFKHALRRLIKIRDRHCQHESGCDVPAEKCHVDHSEAWSRGGPTRQENGQLLCPCHNRAKGSGPP